MGTKVYVLLTAILLASAFALAGISQPAQAEERAEEAAEEAEERAEERAEAAEEEAERAEELAEERARSSEKQSSETGDEGSGPEDVTLKIAGGPETEFSGTCSVGDEENTISGQVPQSFDYSLNGQKLECEIKKQSADDSSLKVILTGEGNNRSVYQISGQGGTIKLTYANGGISSSISSGSGGQVSTSSQVVSSSQVLISSS